MTVNAMKLLPILLQVTVIEESRRFHLRYYRSTEQSLHIPV